MVKRTKPIALTMTVEAAARELGISRNTAYECARTGQIPTVRLGRRLLVPRAALEAMLRGEGRVPAHKAA
jgi:excisionase family DNA binding protein